MNKATRKLWGDKLELSVFSGIVGLFCSGISPKCPGPCPRARVQLESPGDGYTDRKAVIHIWYFEDKNWHMTVAFLNFPTFVKVCLGNLGPHFSLYWLCSNSHVQRPPEYDQWVLYWNDTQSNYNDCPEVKFFSDVDNSSEKTTTIMKEEEEGDAG